MQGSTPVWTVTVLDQDGSPVANKLLDYSVSGVNDKAVTEVAAPTDSYGQLSISYTGTFAGNDVITVFIDLNKDKQPDSALRGTTAVTWTHPTAVSLSPSAVTRTIYLTDVAGYGLESVHVTDSSHTGLFGVPVKITITGPNPLRIGGQVTESGTVVTGTDGTAFFYDVGHIAGFDMITAAVPGVTTATAMSQWIHGAGILLATASNTTPVVNTSDTINISLHDGSGLAIPNVPININITGANYQQVSTTTDDDGNAIFQYSSTVSGQDTLLVYADMDRSGTFTPDEPSNSVDIHWSDSGSGPSTSSLTLSPSSQSLTVGAQATLTVTFSDPSGSNAGVNILYSIGGANSDGGAVTTNDSGNATISHVAQNAGTDTVTAYADLNGNGTLDTGEPSATASVSWTASPTANSPALDAAAPATQQAGCTYFAETQHNLCGDFQSYWNAFGGLAIFGLPITEPFQENGVTTQYFERARFESHPGTDAAKFNVLLGLVGDEVTAGRQTEAPFVATTANPSSDCTFYAATGHNLCGGFQAYWNMYGGLAVYGYPISEEFQEKNLDTGQTYTVQYFERGRFEWHPGEWPERFDVELGRLGSQIFSLKYGVTYH